MQKSGFKVSVAIYLYHHESDRRDKNNKFSAKDKDSYDVLVQGNKIFHIPIA